MLLKPTFTDFFRAATNGVAHSNRGLGTTDDEALSALLAMSKAKGGPRAVYSGAKRWGEEEREIQNGCMISLRIWYMVFGYMAKSAIWSNFLWSQLYNRNRF